METGRSNGINPCSKIIYLAARDMIPADVGISVDTPVNIYCYTIADNIQVGHRSI